MKKATAILLSSVIFASLLCSCGKAADSSAASSAVSTNYFPHSATDRSIHARTHPTTSRAARQPVAQQSNRFQQGMAGWKARYQRA